MSGALGLSMMLLCLGQIPLSTEAELPGGEKAELQADQLVYEPTKKVLTAKGNTVLKTKDLVLRADELVYDQATERAIARGDVMLVSGLMAAVADEIVVNIRSLEATVQGGLFLQKKNVTPEALLTAKNPEELKKLGDTAIAITGSHIRRVGPNDFLVDELAFTPCDCDPTQPSWRVEATTAQVRMGDRAILNWPRVYVDPVPFPVLFVPWLYLPLAERRSGLLVPKVNPSGPSGFTIDVPVFLTLGRSYDVTLTPGYYPAPEGATPSGITGPRLQTEFRYAPSERTSGRGTLGLVYDFRRARDPRSSAAIEGSRRGLRTEASLQHQQELGGGWYDRIDASFLSDGFYTRDLTADIIARENEYLRSTGFLYHRAPDRYFGLEATVRQDLRWGYGPFRNDRSADLLYGPNPLHETPAITYAVPDRPLWGPLSGSWVLDYSHLIPFRALHGDEGVDGVFHVDSADEGQADRQFQLGEREARSRLGLRPRLAADLPFLSVARFSPYLQYRQDLYVGELTGRVRHRGYPMAGGRAHVELWRPYGETVRHVVTPSLELRYVPRVFGSWTGPVYDELDTSVPPRGLLQAVAEVGQGFWIRQGATAHPLLRLDLGQGYHLRERRLAETYGRVSVHHGPVGTSTTARYDLPTKQITQVSSDLGINFSSWGAYARYDNLLSAGSDRMRRGVDALIGTPLSTNEAFERPAQLVSGGRIQFPFGVGTSYEATAQKTEQGFKVRQHIVGLNYAPSCADCWRLDVWLVLGEAFQYANFGLNLNLARFGSFGR